jgi:FAD:protein FMN transferase
VNRRGFLTLLGSGVTGIGGAIAWRRRRDERFVERWSWAMGQAVHLQLFVQHEDLGLEAAAAALAELRRVEARLSRFDPASDLCALNARAGRGLMRVDTDLRAVLGLAQGYRAATAGAFDAAVEPLMRVWGFHQPRASEPAAAEIAAARRAVREAVVRLDGDRAGLSPAYVRLDFGGIGVGYGVDRAVAVLRTAGVRRALVDVGGDCFGLGAPPGEPGWVVRIADAEQGHGARRQAVLRDAGLATSANTVAVLRYGSALRGHVMDPSTGWPATRRQVTIQARSAVAADALSTAALVRAASYPAGFAARET